MSIEPEIKYTKGLVGGPSVGGGLLNSALRFLRCNKYKNINASAASIFIGVRGIHSNPFPAFYRPIKVVGRLTCLSADFCRPAKIGRFYRPIFIVRLTAASEIAPKFGRFLALPNFRGRAFQNLYTRYHPCIATRRLEKFQEDIPLVPKL